MVARLVKARWLCLRMRPQPTRALRSGHGGPGRAIVSELERQGHRCACCPADLCADWRIDVKPAKPAYVPTGWEHGEWLGDVVYVGNTQGSTAHRIFAVMGVDSRYVYARALTEATAARVAEAMEEILVQNVTETSEAGVAPILALRTDGGRRWPTVSPRC